MITMVEVRPGWDTTCDLRRYWLCPVDVDGKQVKHEISKVVFYNIMDAVMVAHNEFGSVSINSLKALS